jgi:hypothetical protein
MAKRMDAPFLWTPKGDPRQETPILDNVVEIVFCKRRKWRSHFEEYLSVGRLRPTRLQVVDQGFPDLIRQRQTQRLVRLRLRDFEC